LAYLSDYNNVFLENSYSEKSHADRALKKKSQRKTILQKAGAWGWLEGGKKTLKSFPSPDLPAGSVKVCFFPH